MIYLWLVVLVLIGAVITLYILLTKKPKADEGKIKDLKKEIITDGKLFEQLEFKLENLREKVLKKKSEISEDDSRAVKVKDCLDEIQKDIEDMTSYFSSSKKKK